MGRDGLVTRWYFENKWKPTGPCPPPGNPRQEMLDVLIQSGKVEVFETSLNGRMVLALVLLRRCSIGWHWGSCPWSYKKKERGALAPRFACACFTLAGAIYETEEDETLPSSSYHECCSTKGTPLVWTLVIFVAMPPEAVSIVWKLWNQHHRQHVVQCWRCTSAEASSKSVAMTVI